MVTKLAKTIVCVIQFVVKKKYLTATSTYGRSLGEPVYIGQKFFGGTEFLFDLRTRWLPNLLKLYVIKMM